MKTQFKYIQFPLMLLQEIHLDYKKAIDNILSFGLVHFALKQDVDEYDAGRQLLYDYNRHHDDLPPKLIKLIEEEYPNDELIDEEIVPFFTSLANESKEEINDITDTLFQNDELREYAIKNCQIGKINEFFSVSGPETSVRLDKYNQILDIVNNHEFDFGRDAYPSIKLNILWDFAKKPDPILFSAYCATLSIQGKYKYTKTNKYAIVGRMIGAKNLKAQKSACKIKKNKSLFEYYTNRYHFDALMGKLLNRGLVKSKISKQGWRYFLISTRLDYIELANEYATRLQKKDHKAKEREAIKIIQQQL